MNRAAAVAEVVNVPCRFGTRSPGVRMGRSGMIYKALVATTEIVLCRIVINASATPLGGLHRGKTSDFDLWGFSFLRLQTVVA